MSLPIKTLKYCQLSLLLLGWGVICRLMQMHIISLKLVFAFIWLFFTVFALFFNVTLPSVPLSPPPLPLSHSGIQLNHHRAGRNSLLSSPEETHHVLWDCRLPKQPQGDRYCSVSATTHKTNKYSTVTVLHSNTPKATHPDTDARSVLDFQ